MSLEGKVALVTGGGRGIGRGIALRLARDGANIALVDVRADGIDAVAAEIAAIGSKSTTFVADVGDRGQVFAAVDHATAALGGFDIMVNNAGIALVGPISDVTPEEVGRIWAINVDGVLWGIQAAVAKFKELGNKDSGRISRIINASSIAGHDGFAMLGVYSATKFAVRALTQAAAKEHAADGITVNAYCPGVVGTDMWVEIDKRFAELTGAAEGETYDKFVGGIALGRAETPDDVAGFVSYLAGPDADYMTGQSGLIDGGLVYR
jgi:meso-butanediol dehydrogenase / (S,S)-butanediol dehydrogenase / diacetyl reductase